MFLRSRLYAIVDTGLLGDRVVPGAVEALLAGGVRLLQYRHKGPFMRRHFDDCRAIAEMARSAGALFLVNDRADAALLAGAGGVHVGQDDLPPVRVRGFLPADQRIGFSTHNLEQACAGARLPVDYLAIGPVFPTATKERPDTVIGLATVRACRDAIRAAAAEAGKPAPPLVAIGGITLDNAHSVLAAGADAVAVARDLLSAGDLRERARQFVERLDS